MMDDDDDDDFDPSFLVRAFASHFVRTIRSFLSLHLNSRFLFLFFYVYVCGNACYSIVFRLFLLQIPRSSCRFLFLSSRKLKRGVLPSKKNKKKPRLPAPS